MRWLARTFAVLALIGAALWLLGPYEEASLDAAFFDERLLDGGVAAHFEETEQRFSDIRDGSHKRVVWRRAPEQRTEWSVLYVHGFSANLHEIRPVPDRVAQALDANLVFTRLQGHGRSGDAMAEATVEGWMSDIAEGMAVARKVGEKVLIISTSTGGTLSAASALDPDLSEGLKGIVFVSPNFGVNSPLAPVLTFPGARYWLPLVAGERRSFEPQSEGQRQHWTIDYPTVAVLPMAALVKEVVKSDLGQAMVPALFWFTKEDTVVQPLATFDVASRWGGPAEVVNPVMGPQDDPGSHVIAGDIMSPSQTDRTVVGILEWAEEIR